VATCDRTVDGGRVARRQYQGRDRGDRARGLRAVPVDAENGLTWCESMRQGNDKRERDHSENPHGACFSGQARHYKRKSHSREWLALVALSRRMLSRSSAHSPLNERASRWTTIPRLFFMTARQNVFSTWRRPDPCRRSDS
jgi:hypothetical protein